MRYGVRSSINCGRLIPRVRRVRSRICVLNLSRAFDAMRRSPPSFEMLKPRNLRSSGRATALFASAFEVPAGHFFRIVSVEGPQVGDLNLWNAHDLTERFYSGKTRALHAT